MRRSQSGIGFEVWDAQQTWFWFVIDPQSNGGTIGTAVTEAEAVRAACSSIEEMSGSADARQPCALATRVRLCTRVINPNRSQLDYLGRLGVFA